MAEVASADEDYLDGVFVLVDTTGVYVPELEAFVPQVGGRVSVYRIVLEDLVYTNGELLQAGHPVWFNDQLTAVAEYLSWGKSELILDLCSDDPGVRGYVWHDLANYLGYHEFDQYPLDLSKAEVKKRVKPYVKSLEKLERA